MSGEGAISGRNIITTRMRRGTVVCPICNSDAGIRDSDKVTGLATDLWCICLNVDCGLTWKAQIVFVHMLSPSGIDSDVELPPPPAGYRRRVLPPGPPPAPDDPNQLKMFDDSGASAATRSAAA